MMCQADPDDATMLLCDNCKILWHMPCLIPPLDNVPNGNWVCPDCAQPLEVRPLSVVPLRRTIRGRSVLNEVDGHQHGVITQTDVITPLKNNVLGLCNAHLSCPCSLQQVHQPVTAPCGHSCCLKCMQKWLAMRKMTCLVCRGPIPAMLKLMLVVNVSLAG